MKTIPSALAVLSLLALAACADRPTPVAGAPEGVAPLLSAGEGRGVPGAYVVVLKDGAEPRAVAAVAGVHPRHVYTSALSGFAAELNAGQLNALRRHPAVAYVEQDQVATGQAVHWGLDRIDQQFLPLNGVYTANTTASSVYAYVIDTGITPTHPELVGRVVNVFDAFGGTGVDCNGHGTIISRIIGSSTVGVATAVKLRGVRVLNCAGSGTTSGIIAGVDWVRINRINPAVANLSLGGGGLALNTAVNALANSGVAVSVAAGNGNTNACSVSPAGATAALTVASSSIADAHVAGSNYGSCVDLYAPASAPPGVSGTSFSAPYVAGVAALYKAYVPTATTAAVNAWIVGNATSGVLSGVPVTSPNLLLYKASL